MLRERVQVHPEGRARVRAHRGFGVQLCLRAALVAASACAVFAAQSASSSSGVTIGGLGQTSTVVPFDNLKDRQVHFNAHLIAPILLSSDGSQLYAINQGGSRLAVFDTASMLKVADVPLGPGLVSMALRPGANELWLTDRVSGSIDVVDLSTLSIAHSIRVDAEPHGIAFTATGDRAYVACSGVSRVDVVRTSNYTVAAQIDIPAKDPRAIVWSAGSAYVVPLLSGNDTAPVGAASSGPDVDNIVAVDSLALHPTLPQLPDRDLLVIPTSSDPATDQLDLNRTVRGLGTLLFNLHARPGTNELWVPNTDALNVVHKGEKNFVAGQCTSNRLSIVDLSSSHGGTTIVDLDALAPSGIRCAQPTGLAFDPIRPRVYVCSYGGDAVDVLDLSGATPTWFGTIDIPFANVYPQLSSPRACVVDAAGTYLYVLNKGDTSLTRIDLTQLPTTAGFAISASAPYPLGWDAVSGAERFGRNDLVNGKNSKSQTTSCASCHADGNYDGLVWDLSKFLDPEGTPNSALSYPLDDKGPMVTQSVRRLAETGPWHWRGEKSKLFQFNKAFVDLMERQENGVPKDLGPHFQYISHYMKHVSYPANARERADRGLRPLEARGAVLFTQKPVFGNATCASCHALPLGTNGEIVPSHVRGVFPMADTPQLRALADKLTPAFTIGGNFGTRTELGAGLTHGGAFPTIQSVLLAPHPTIAGAPAFNLTPAEADAIAAFLNVFDTGLAPSTAFQATAEPSNALQIESNELAYLISEAERGNCDLIFRAPRTTFQGVTVWPSGMYDVSIHAFRTAQAAAAPLAPHALIQQAQSGSAITFIGVPLWMGLPMALDRDLDQLYDLDEIAAGTQIENADSDGDGFPDGYEVALGMNPLSPDVSSPDTTPPNLIGVPKVVFATTNSIKLEFQTTEAVHVEVSYDGNAPVARLPLDNNFDDRFSLVINELAPAKTLAIDLELTDPSGNVTHVPFAASTKPRYFADPVYVSDIAPAVSTHGANSVFNATVTLRAGQVAPQPGYVVTAALYFADASGALSAIASSTTSTLVATDGTVDFTLPLPSGASHPGTLTFVVLGVQVPVGLVPYAGAQNVETFTSIAW